MATIIKTVKLTKTTSVPDRNGCTNFGGIDNKGNTIFCCKTNQAETATTIFKFNKYNSTNFSSFKVSGLGHGNGMAYYNGCCYIPGWGSKHNHKGIYKVDVETHKKVLLSGPGTSAVSHAIGNIFFIRGATSADKKTIIFYSVKVVGNTYKIVQKVTIKNPKYKTENVNQDFYYNQKTGKLYIPLTNSNLRKNAVLVTKIGITKEDGTFEKAGKILSPDEVWMIETSSGKYEIESITCDNDGHLLFGMNTNSDGIYKKA